MSTNSEIVETLRAGGVGVLSTDTLYGLVGSALLPEAVERIYELKRRDREKPLIVLIADIEDVERFGVVLSEELILQLEKYWPHSSSAGAEALRGKPGPYSVILPSVDDEFSYLHRGGGTIAFRLPDKDDLCELLRDVGLFLDPIEGVSRETFPVSIELIEWDASALAAVMSGLVTAASTGTTMTMTAG